MYVFVQSSKCLNITYQCISPKVEISNYQKMNNTRMGNEVN
jgi:hypothetical protein